MIARHTHKSRSRGGGHEASNTASLCSCCHLELVHDRAAINAVLAVLTCRSPKGDTSERFQTL